MTAALRFQGVVKQFGRKVRALDGLSFEIPKGCIAGFVGHNGAGKTTAFSVVSGYLLPDAGEVDILGHGPFDARVLKGSLGVLPQDASLPERHSPTELLDHLCRLQGMSAREARVEAGRVLSVVGLEDRAHQRIGALSHGMRRRVAVAQALLGRPALVLLDEPTSGLDPKLVADMRALLARQRGAHGMSLVVSSHVLSDLEALCDHVVFMDKGRCLRSGSLAEVTGRTRAIRFQLASPPPLEALLTRLQAAQLPGTPQYHDRELVLELPVDQDPTAATQAWLRVLLELEAGVEEVRRGASLEQAFLAER